MASPLRSLPVAGTQRPGQPGRLDPRGEAAFRVDGEDLTGRQTITMRSRARVDQDQLRSLSVGTAELISAGRRERVRIV